jgi:cobalt/nickel transport system ATP-binding protein
MDVIEVEDLVYSYPDGTRALDGVSFAIKEGESVALLGPNGAGKSTLLLHLNGLLRGHGRVRIMGQTIEKGNLVWVRSQVGMVFQDPDDQLFMPTLAEDVAFGPRNLGLSEDQVKERVAFSLDYLGLGHLAEKSPHHLSFGQKKRAAIASILSMKPRVLVLDEPTSNLDPRFKRQMVSLIRSLQDNGTTILTATHDVNLVPLLADRVMLLDRRIVANGPSREILCRRELMKEQGLEMPAIADVFLRLQEQGIYSGSTPLTQDEAVKAVRELLAKKNIMDFSQGSYLKDEKPDET